ncbi:MAG: PAS domain S-box protein [Gemmataceae bacterium]
MRRNLAKLSLLIAAYVATAWLALYLGAMNGLAAAIWVVTASLLTLIAANAERRRVHAELRESEDRYRKLVETFPDAIVISRDDRIVFANPAAQRFFGAQAGTLEGRSLVGFLDVTKPLPPGRTGFTDLKLPGLPREYRLTRLDGSVIDVELAVIPFRDQGSAAHLFVLHDVSERTRAENAVRESESRYRLLAETSPDSILLVDTRGQILWCNRQTSELFGRTLDELKGLDAFDLVAEEDRARAQASLQTTLTEGTVERMEYVLLRRDERFPAEACAALIHSHDGKPASVIAVIRDISARKQAELSLRAALREKETLLKEIHHRVKNNLAVIDSLLNLQAGAVEEAAALEALLESRNRIRSMAAVHDSLYRAKDFSRIELGNYLHDLCDSLSYTYGGAQRQLEMRVQVESLEVGLDLAIPLALIVNELVSNALKHAFPPGRSGWIEVSLVHGQNGDAILSVADSGVGVPAELDIAHPTTLGLELVSTLAEQINGQLELSRTGGSRFRIAFPHRSTRTGQPHEVYG